MTLLFTLQFLMMGIVGEYLNTWTVSIRKQCAGRCTSWAIRRGLRLVSPSARIHCDKCPN